MSRVLSSDKPVVGKAETVEEMLSLVRQHGGRVTTSRRLLLQALFDASGHRNAEELAEVVQRRAPMSTFRPSTATSTSLTLGVIVHAHLGHGPAYYHVAAGAHGHLVLRRVRDNGRSARQAIRRPL